AGILSIGAILGNIWYSAVLLFFYSLGNLVPLFILSIIYDKSNISQSRFIQGKTFEISIAGKRYHFNSTNIISGLLFLIIGTVLLVYKGTSIVNKFDIFGTKQYFYSIQRQFIVWKHADALGVAVFALFIAAIVLFFWKSRKGRINGTEFVKNRYDYYSKFYDIFEFFPEMLFRRWRKKYIALLKGSILEVGVGTGKNLQYYSKESKVTGIDFSSKMLAKAIKESNRLKSDHSLLQMDAQRLQFKDNTFDSVLCTFVLCSVPNPVRALKEMKRVCKPNGNIMIIEHVLSKNRLIAFFQRIHNPITLFLFGFNITRDTVSNIKKAGLKIMTEKNLTSNDVFKLVICRPGGKD
ncbi:MAG: methyltransferase domain-containing protein, partial [Candidatus Nanoarchaeia archaeon]